MDLWAHPTSYGPLTWTPEELFGDSRGFGKYAGPPRFVKLPQATPDGGAIAHSQEYQKNVIVGRESEWTVYFSLVINFRFRFFTDASLLKTHFSTSLYQRHRSNPFGVERHQ